MASFSRTKKIVKLFTSADWLLIAVFLIAAILLMFKVNSQDSVAKIYYKGNLKEVVKLSEDRVIKIDDSIILQVKAGKIRIKKNTCPHQYCVKQGWSNSLPIICVPNKLAIYFEKDEQILITR